MASHSLSKHPPGIRIAVAGLFPWLSLLSACGSSAHLGGPDAAGEEARLLSAKLLSFSNCNELNGHLHQLASERLRTRIEEQRQAWRNSCSRRTRGTGKDASLSAENAAPQNAGAGSCSNWWSNASSTVRRSVWMDDTVYSVSDRRLKANRLENLAVDLANLEF